jgi:EAL domain-containing protein (putative c-di-GMP-specific phosphodiesterase class I)/PAS domain-containing protein
MPTDLIGFSWHAIPYFPAALLMAGTGWWIHARERGSRLSLEFFAFSTLFALWMLLLGVRLLLIDAHAATVLSRHIYAVVLLGLTPLLQFSFTVLDTRHERRGTLRASRILGIALALCAVGTSWGVADVVQLPWGFEPRQGVLGPLFTLWVVGLLGLLAADAVRAWRKGRRGALHRRQVRMFGASVAILAAATVDLVTDAVGAPTYPVAVACVLAFTLMTAHITIRHGIANVTARFASPAFADVMRAGLVILDQEGVIQFSNERAARMLHRRRHDLVGQALAAVLGEAAAPQALAALARAPADGGGEVAYQPPRAEVPRLLSLSVSTLNDTRGEASAFVCLLRDVTDEHRHRQAAVPQPTLEEVELREAVAARQFVVHYQPIVELRYGTVAGFEALVRWLHPRLGPLRPDNFLPAAEVLGVLGAIDRFVLEQACADLPRLRAETGVPTLFVSVNQSTAALSSPTLVRDASELVARCGLAPKDVRLELLESTIVIDSVRETLCALRDAGFGVCIDDFGTGQSALSRLHEVCVTGLKVDRLFVREMLGGNGRKIIASIVALANTLELGVIAEGVTAPEQVALLREMGCGYAQGFLYSPPIGLEETINLVRRRIAARQRRAQVLEARAGIEPTYGDLQSPA